MKAKFVAAHITMYTTQFCYTTWEIITTALYIASTAFTRQAELSSGSKLPAVMILLFQKLSLDQIDIRIRELKQKLKMKAMEVG